MRDSLRARYDFIRNQFIVGDLELRQRLGLVWLVV